MGSCFQWHPDKWTRTPALVAEANQKFQQIQEAYSDEINLVGTVLSDAKKRALYDADLYDPDDDEEDEIEGFADFLQEMTSLMNDARKEDKIYSIEELRSMFWRCQKVLRLILNGVAVLCSNLRTRSSGYVAPLLFMRLKRRQEIHGKQPISLINTQPCLQALIPMLQIMFSDDHKWSLPIFDSSVVYVIRAQTSALFITTYEWRMEVAVLISCYSFSNWAFDYYQKFLVVAYWAGP
ncbi:UNVERIFIED_CONTAM: hypothetical protein Sangu_0149800 [Sesamum angustifolium]|uniref:J domain-containing protein n=1 Tax=Sesamum angustifolium TaxID=2727405 RepID=A0AAW2RKR4_9LAMI